MKFRTYIDTSVIGGCYDDEFKSGKKIAVISDLTLKEIEEAPRNVKDILNGIPTNYREYVTLNDEAKLLAQRYIKERAVSKSHLVDAQQIAIAIVNKVDVLVSWNFKHIVNLKKIRLYNSINLKYGYPMLEIRSPMEVLDER
jgi:hypothetical protein